jgi:hypothetical protein
VKTTSWSASDSRRRPTESPAKTNLLAATLESDEEDAREPPAPEIPEFLAEP